MPQYKNDTTAWILEQGQMIPPGGVVELSHFANDARLILVSDQPTVPSPILFAGDVAVLAGEAETVQIPQAGRIWISLVAISGSAVVRFGDAAHGIPVDAKGGYAGEFPRERIGRVRIESPTGGCVRLVIEEVS